MLVIEELQRQDPGFLELCWKDSRFRRAERTHFIARAKEKLGTEHFQSEAREMDNGWWLSMQTQTQKKWELLEAAADIAKMDVIVEGERWQAEETARLEVGF